MKRFDFLITNSAIDEKSTSMKLIKSVGSFQIFAESVMECFDYGEISILIDGYILPVNTVFEESVNSIIHETVVKHYLKNKQNFINNFKGYFSLIIIDRDVIEIYTDQLGLKTLFYTDDINLIAVTNNVQTLKLTNFRFQKDEVSLALKTVLNRFPLHYTVFQKLSKTTAATCIRAEKNRISVKQYWEVGELLGNIGPEKEANSIEHFALLFQENFRNFLRFLKPENSVITLTGGKDSRTGLAVLKSLKIPVTGFTYGNQNSRDAVYAKKLAEAVSVPHFVFSPPGTEEWHHKITDTIMRTGNPEVSIFRAHRMYAFRQMFCRLKGISAYFAGNLGGELLMGLFYDNLIFTKFLTDFWNSRNILTLENYCNDGFFRLNSEKADAILERLSEMQSFKQGLNNKEREFFALFEIGVPHHAQDLFLASEQADFVYPFYLDIDFLRALFKSRFSFLYMNNKTANILLRYRLYEFNLKIQHLLAPEMDTIYFGKRGSYNTREFLNGRFYWAMVKSFRYFMKNVKYPPSYSYNTNFIYFLLKQMHNITSDHKSNLRKLYRVHDSMDMLSRIKENSSEAELQKFANIVQIYLQFKKYTE